MLSVFQRKCMACLFFSTKQLPKSGKLGVCVSCVPLQRNQGSKSFRLDQHYFCHPVHWWLVLNSGIAGMGQALLWNQQPLLAGSSAVSSLAGSCLRMLLLGLVSLLVSPRLMMYCGITSVLLLKNSLCDITSMVILPSSYQFLKGGSCHLMLDKWFISEFTAFLVRFEEMRE